MGRILAIDYGEKRIGLALSDENKEFAFEYEIWQAADFFKKISGLISEKEIEKIVLGKPVNLKGESTKKTQEVLRFQEKLQKTLPQECKIDLLDERLSSKMAEKIAGTSKNIDALAAQIFLQNYLNKNAKQNSSETEI